jgi:glycosyltransferase involved in cell wall biosynthesis
MAKKKILIFSLGYYPKLVGGAEVAIKEITDRIASDEYEFHMVCNRYDSTLPKTEQIGDVLIHRIGITQKNPDIADLRKFPLHLNKLLFQFFAYYTAKQLHKKYQYDGIWAMMAHSCAVPAGMFKRKFPTVPYILTLQEGDPPEYIEKKMRVFGSRFKNGFVSADVLQTISTFLMDWGKKMGYTGTAQVIPNAVDIAHFTRDHSSAEIQTVKDTLGKKEGDVYLVTTSRLVHKNAVDDVIRAVALLPSRVHFVVYGTGPDQDMLEKLITKLGIANRVHLLGHIDHSVMPKHLRACDIFVRPSRSEGMGNSFLEAMATSLPVIATQEGGISDFLFDSTRSPDTPSTGWVVDADTPEQIANAVTDIMENPQKVHEITAHAKNMVCTKYDWDFIAKDMKEKVFDQAMRYTGSQHI